MIDKSSSIENARAERSLKKRRAVEKALETLLNNNEVITFKAVANLAGVSRPYLYKNFKSDIEKLRDKSSQKITKIEGIRVPNRTKNEYQHIEAVLRKQINKLKEEIKNLRREVGNLKIEKARIKRQLEEERGRTDRLKKVMQNKQSD